MKDCKEFRDRMIDVAFGEAERNEDFDCHIGQCAGCGREFRTLLFAAKGIEDAPSAPAPSLSNERLHQAILSSDLRRRPSWLPRLAFAGAAAALAMAAWMGFGQQPVENSVEPIATNSGTHVEPFEAAQGPIRIPESAPLIARASEPKAASPVGSVKRAALVVKRSAKRPSDIPVLSDQVPDELLAVVASGAESALEVDQNAIARGGALSEPAPGSVPGGSESTEKPIVIIQGRGQATERPSDDVSIGG